MFFTISNKLEKNFPYNYSLSNNLFLNHDLGWKNKKFKNINIFYKGYSDEYSDEELFEKILENPIPHISGNFTAILDLEKEIIISHDNCRSYPIYFQEDIIKVSNLDTEGKRIEFNNFIKIHKKNNHIEVVNLNISPTIEKNINLDQAIDKIDNILNQSIEKFISKNKKSIKIILSGGLDSTLVFSYIKKFTKNYELIDCEYRKWTTFTKNNWKKISKVSNQYLLSHSWGETPVLFANGYYGDQFFMRDLTPLRLLLNHYKINIFEQIEKHKGTYNNNHFKKPAEFDRSENNLKDKKYRIIEQDLEKTKKYCLNILAGTYLIWGLDHTIYYTPFKNLKIPNIILNLPINDLIDNAFQCTIQKKLLQRNDDKLLDIVFDEKNNGNFNNLVNYLKNEKL